MSQMEQRLRGANSRSITRAPSLPTPFLETHTVSTALRPEACDGPTAISFPPFAGLRVCTLGVQPAAPAPLPCSHLVLLQQLCVLVSGCRQCRLELLHTAPQLRHLPLQVQLALHQVIPFLLALIQLVLRTGEEEQRRRGMIRRHPMLIFQPSGSVGSSLSPGKSGEAWYEGCLQHIRTCQLMLHTGPGPFLAQKPQGPLSLH